MTALTCRAQAGPTSTVLTLSGALDRRSASAVRSAVLRCLADQPAALVVDVSALVLRCAPALRADLPRWVAAMFRRCAAEVPAVPVLLCGAGPELATALDQQHGPDPLSRYADRATAIAAAARLAPDGQVRLVLDPDAAAPQAARAAVTGFCHARGLDDVADDAVVIISELVANAVAHARTGMTVVITVAGPNLHLVVRDGSARRPRLRAPGQRADTAEGGRGLYLVQRLATRWGWRSGYHGKAVWATVRTSRPAVR